MAKRPPILPKWATTPYGGDDLAWQEALRQCRDALYAWAAVEKYGFYGDLVPLITAVSWPEGPHTHEGSQIGHLLGQVVMGELDIKEDRPLISALVVAREDNMPSFGFWNLLAELDIHVGASTSQRLTFWVAEVKRCLATYGKIRPLAGDGST